MKHPDDMDFKPRLKIVESTLFISNGESQDTLAQFSLEEEHMLVAQRDQRIELKSEISSPRYAWKIEYNQSDYR